MTQRLQKFWQLIFADLGRYQKLGEFKNYGKANLIFNALIVRKHGLAFLFWLRFLSIRPPRVIRLFARIYFNNISSKYTLQIPVETKIGPGLYIGHGCSIIINGATVIGKNCSISHFVSIGSNKGTPATIGDNVYIGPNVSIVEDVKIGDNVKIGAGTVVVKNIPDNSTSVGNPNRICNQRMKRLMSDANEGGGK